MGVDSEEVSPAERSALASRFTDPPGEVDAALGSAANLTTIVEQPRPRYEPVGQALLQNVADRLGWSLNPGVSWDLEPLPDR